MKAKKTMQLLVVVALTVIMVACGNNESTSSNTESASTADQETGQKQVTISLQSIYPDPNHPQYKVLHKISDDYMAANPNIKIEFDSMNPDQQKLKIKTQAAARELPDITVVSPSEQMKPFVDAGLFAPLNDVVEQNGLKDTFQTGVLDYFSFNNNVYALPEGNNIEVVFYNKELFAKAGVEVPETFEDMIEAVKTFKSHGIQPMVIGEKDSWTGSFLFMNILLRTNDGPGFLKDILAGKKTFNDPAFVEAAEKLQDLVQAGAFQEGATSFDYNSGENLFKTGKAAMYIMGTWASGNVEEGLKEKAGVFKFPTIEGKGDLDQYMVAPTTGYAVSAESKHVKEAKDFLNYYFLHFPKVSFEMKNAVGIAQKVEGDFKAAGYMQMSIELMDMFKNVKGGDLAFDNTMNPALTQVHKASIQNLFVQKKDPNIVAQEHQAAFERN